MRSNTKKLSPILFAAVIACFFLPFMELSCEGEKIVTLTGVQMVTGTEVKQRGSSSDRQQSKPIKPSPLAGLAIIAALAGLGLSFVAGRAGALLPCIGGIAGFVCLLLLRQQFESEAMREGQGMITVHFLVGYWAATLLLVATVLLNAYVFITIGKSSKKI